LADRHNNVVRLRDSSGSWVMVTDGLRAFDSMLTELADPLVAPELFLMREQLRSWRFYDHLRTDALAPARASHIGTRTMVLGADGADLAAALRTIIEVGDAAGLREAIDDAFPRSTIDIEVQSGHFELVMRQHGLLRPLRTPELSDGTMRYLLLAAALLTPRPPELLVLNEPETSLHEELLAPLASLITAAARKCQIVIVSHSAVLIDALGRSAAGTQIVQLVKEAGQTKLVDQEPLDEPSWKWPAR
jgi:predicted ATPase